MKRELAGVECGQPVVVKPELRNPAPTTTTPTPKIDICGVLAAAFHLNLKKPDNTFFRVSLYEIDRLIKEKKSQEEVQINEIRCDGQTEESHVGLGAEEQQPHESELDWLRRRLPKTYQDYADVFSKVSSDVLPPYRYIDFKIKLNEGVTEEDLGFSPLYHQSVAELEEIKKYLTENLDKGFIAPSQAPYASPVLFVKKANGSLHFCIDFRKLNVLTRKDRYPLPLIDETLAALGKARIYTKLDIRQAFHRIRMHPDAEELTSFRTRYGQYKCKVLPFGLSNGPSTYQRYMNDTLFEYLDVFCTSYLDDILIYSDNAVEHELHVKKVLERLRKAGLQADIKKSEFSITKTKYLGFIVSTEGIMADPEKVKAVFGVEGSSYS